MSDQPHPPGQMKLTNLNQQSHSWIKCSNSTQTIESPQQTVSNPNIWKHTMIQRTNPSQQKNATGLSWKLICPPTCGRLSCIRKFYDITRMEVDLPQWKLDSCRNCPLTFKRVGWIGLPLLEKVRYSLFIYLYTSTLWGWTTTSLDSFNIYISVHGRAFTRVLIQSSFYSFPILPLSSHFFFGIPLLYAHLPVISPSEDLLRCLLYLNFGVSYLEIHLYEIMILYVIRRYHQTGSIIKWESRRKKVIKNHADESTNERF